eukprot:TRINITY_DN156_c0_g1_i3.p1 TRINITY_DN156_c0_g1~~TRINITY_DN156_c0_g1_i3.p1  ORF type:complete len:288 (-),score=27.81 TRINITY_DN156_c0_g1_i3:224-967(-)
MTGNYLIYKQNLSKKHTVTKLKSKHCHLNPLPANRVACRGVADGKIEIKKSVLTDEDVAKMIKDFNFPISSETMIEKAKQFVLSQQETGAFDADMMADDFQFVAPIIGPLKKEEFLKAFARFKIDKFTDTRTNYHNLMIDPFQPNRVWMFSAGRGKLTGPLPNGQFKENMKYIAPPEANSVTFNEQGKITKFTVGYVMDRTVGNSGGLGGIFGLLYAFGNPLPFPEAKPLKLSWQFRLFFLLGRLLN